MEEFIQQIVNGLDRGSAYALIALGLTLIFGTLGVVNFAHGALFMIGAFVAILMGDVLGDIRELGSADDFFKLVQVVEDPTQTDFLGRPLAVETSYWVVWFGENVGHWLSDWSVPIAVVVSIPIMIFIGWAMERGLIRHFYHRPHADQILVTFGLAIVLGDLIRAMYGANPIQAPMPEALSGPIDLGIYLGYDIGTITYSAWRIVYFFFSMSIIAAVFAFLQFTTFGMVVRAGMADRETVGLLGININKYFTLMFGLAAAVAGVAGVMFAPIQAPSYNLGMEYLVPCFVVVVVGGMGSLPGAVLAGFLLGIVQSFASLPSWKTGLVESLGLDDTNLLANLIIGVDQIAIYLIAIIILLTRPRGLMGRKGVMED
jgi:branched-subunit amino acid ABC-type transport system permease component